MFSPRGVVCAEMHQITVSYSLMKILLSMLICNKKTEKKPLTTKENWLLSFKYADYL